MRIRYFFFLGFFLPVFFFGYADLRAQSGKTEKPPASSVMQEMEIYQEAMSWIRKGEDMFDTDLENSDEQAEMFRKAIEIRPEFHEAHYNLGLIYLHQNKMKEAAVAFESVLRLEPDSNPDIYYLLGAAYNETGNLQEAADALEKGIRQ